MAVAGLGVGPSFAVFTLAVQNAVPVKDLGTATSSVTLFQQVGGTVGLAITGTLFGSTLLEEIPRQLTSAGVPAEFANEFASGGASTFNDFTSVGDLGASILAAGRRSRPALRRAADPGHRRRHPHRLLDRHRLDVRRRHRHGTACAALIAVLMPAGKIGEREEARGASTADRAVPEPSTD